MTPTGRCQWPDVGIGPAAPFVPVLITLVLASVRTSIAYGRKSALGVRQWTKLLINAAVSNDVAPD